MRAVVGDEGPDGIFDLDAGDVVKNFVVADDDVAALADVNAGILRAADDAAFHQHAHAFDGINGVESWVLHDEVTISDVAGPVVDDTITGVVADEKTLHQELIRRALDGVAQFILAVENRAFAVYLHTNQAEAGFINHD